MCVCVCVCLCVCLCLCLCVRENEKKKEKENDFCPFNLNKLDIFLLLSHLKQASYLCWVCALTNHPAGAHTHTHTRTHSPQHIKSYCVLVGATILSLSVLGYCDL